MSVPLPLRVMVEEAWDEVSLKVPPAMRLGELKRMALEATKIARDPSSYLLKFRGAELDDESRTLAEAGLVPNGALIVLRRRRQPVR